MWGVPSQLIVGGVRGVQSGFGFGALSEFFQVDGLFQGRLHSERVPGGVLAVGDDGAVVGEETSQPPRLRDAVDGDIVDGDVGRRRHCGDEVGPDAPLVGCEGGRRHVEPDDGPDLLLQVAVVAGVADTRRHGVAPLGRHGVVRAVGYGGGRGAVAGGGTGGADAGAVLLHGVGPRQAEYAIQLLCGARRIAVGARDAGGGRGAVGQAVKACGALRTARLIDSRLFRAECSWCAGRRVSGRLAAEISSGADQAVCNGSGGWVGGVGSRCAMGRNGRSLFAKAPRWTGDTMGTGGCAHFGIVTACRTVGAVIAGDCAHPCIERANWAFSWGEGCLHTICTLQTNGTDAFAGRSRLVAVGASGTGGGGNRPRRAVVPRWAVGGVCHVVATSQTDVGARW